MALALITAHRRVDTTRINLARVIDLYGDQLPESHREKLAAAVAVLEQHAGDLADQIDDALGITD